jgi:PBP1b-binding outer membrane lipoprotein LpoB
MKKIVSIMALGALLAVGCQKGTKPSTPAEKPAAATAMPAKTADSQPADTPPAAAETTQAAATTPAQNQPDATTPAAPAPAVKGSQLPATPTNQTEE